MAPWASPEMVQERMNQLENAIEAAKASGGCEQAVQSLEVQLKQQTKKSAEPGLVLGQIESTKGYITRVVKRHTTITDQIAELQQQQAEIEKDLSETRKRLACMEAEAAKVLNVQRTPAPNGTEALMDAVRTLMVSLHRLDIPPEIQQAATAVQQQLPEEPVSEDYTGNAPEEEPRGASEEESTMEEFDRMDDEDDVALLAMARRLKRARRRSRSPRR